MAGLRVEDYHRLGRLDNPHYNAAPLGVNMSTDCDGITSSSASVPNGYLKERQDDNKSCYSNNSSPHTPDDLSSSNKVCFKHFMFFLKSIFTSFHVDARFRNVLEHGPSRLCLPARCSFYQQQNNWKTSL